MAPLERAGNGRLPGDDRPCAGAVGHDLRCRESRGPGLLAGVIGRRAGDPASQVARTRNPRAAARARDALDLAVKAGGQVAGCRTGQHQHIDKIVRIRHRRQRRFADIDAAAEAAQRGDVALGGGDVAPVVVEAMHEHPAFVRERDHEFARAASRDGADPGASPVQGGGGQGIGGGLIHRARGWRGEKERDQRGNGKEGLPDGFHRRIVTVQEDVFNRE